MPVRNPTKWTPPSGRGFVTTTANDTITTQSALNLTTQSGVNLQLESTLYKKPYVTGWNKSTKGKTKWQTASGSGYVINAGNKSIVTNNSFQLTDNLGNLIATTDVYNINKYATSWNKSIKNKTSWNTPSGRGRIVTVGTNYIITNSGDFIITNDGKFIVTTPTYNSFMNTTQWTLSGA